MKPHSKKLLSVLLLCMAATAFAQNPSIQVVAQVGATSSTLSSGGTLSLVSTSIGQPVTATFTVLNSGATTISVSQVSFTGSSDITLNAPHQLPVSLPPGSSLNFSARYLPSSGSAATNLASIAFSNVNTSAVFNFSITGTVPDLALSYFIQPDGPVISLAPGGTVQFPAASLQSSKIATIIVTNRGSAPASLLGQTANGAGFQIQSFATLPFALQPTAELRTNVVFTPQQTGVATGSFRLDFADRSIVTFLQASGSSDLNVYYFLQTNGNAVPLAHGGVLAFGATSLNATALATVVISNQSGTAGRVTGCANGH